MNLSLGRSFAVHSPLTFVFDLSFGVSLMVPLALVQSSPIISWLVSSLLLGSGWAGVGKFSSDHVFVAPMACFCTVTCLLIVTFNFDFTILASSCLSYAWQ